MQLLTFVHSTFIPPLRKAFTMSTVVLTMARPAVALGLKPGWRKKSLESQYPVIHSD
jgi:hypothetical protein